MKCCKKSKPQDSEESDSPYSAVSQQPSTTASERSGKSPEACDEELFLKGAHTFDQNTSHLPYVWFPALHNVKNIEYVNKMENEFMGLQKAFLSLTTHFARIQFRLRQIMAAAPEERYNLLLELEKIAFEGAEDNCCNEELPSIQRDFRCMGDVRRKQRLVIRRLRRQLTSLCEASELEGPKFTEEELRAEQAYVNQQSGSLTPDDKKSKSRSNFTEEEFRAEQAYVNQQSGSLTPNDKKPNSRSKSP